MFRRSTAGQGTAEVDPANAIYRLFKNTRNPFVQRAIAPQPQRTNRSEREMSDLASMLDARHTYKVGAANTSTPFRRRQLKHPEPPPTPEPRYLEPSQLVGNQGQLPFLIDDFFQGVLSRLEADPNAFFTVIQELTDLLRAHNVRIKIYEAYQELQDWDDLLDTLTEIAHYPSLETFDLFCSALLAYHDLVNPPAAPASR